MANVFTLDSLRESLEKKYAPTVIGLGDQEVTLQNLLRLPKTKRTKASTLLKSMKRGEGEEPIDTDELLEVMKTVIETVATDAKAGKALTREIGDDLSLASEVIHMWSEATQAGEASNSDA